MNSSSSGKKSTRASERIGLYSADQELQAALRESVGGLETRYRRRLHVRELTSIARFRRQLERLLLVSWAVDIDEAVCSRIRSATSDWKGFLLFTGRLPSEALPQRLAMLRVQDASRLNLVSAETPDEAERFVRSLVERLSHPDEERIINAWVDEESLELFTSSFRVVHVPLDKIAPLRGATLEETRQLEVSYDGTYLRWPGLDVHITVDGLESLVSDDAILRRKQESREFNRRYGEAIRSVRGAHDLRQADIRGLSERHLGRIERGEQRATLKALKVLAKAHGLSTAQYMERLAEALAEEEEGEHS